MIQPQQLTIEETEQLLNLMRWCINGSEHGVQTYDQWIQKCRELRNILEKKDYNVNWSYPDKV